MNDEDEKTVGAEAVPAPEGTGPLIEFGGTEGEPTVRASDGDGWSVTLSEHESPELGYCVSCWVTMPDGTRAHAERSPHPFTAEGAAEALAAAKRTLPLLRLIGGDDTGRVRAARRRR